MRSEATINIYCPVCRISSPRETKAGGSTCYVCGSRLPREMVVRNSTFEGAATSRLISTERCIDNGERDRAQLKRVLFEEGAL
jgi:hypothetical protein